MKKKMIPDKQLSFNISYAIIITVLLYKEVIALTLSRDEVILGSAVVGKAKILMLSGTYRSGYYSCYAIALAAIVISTIINLKFYDLYKEQIQKKKIYLGLLIALNLPPYIICAALIFLV